MSSSEPLHIDWRSAQVQGGTLSVELEGEAPKAWKKHFEGVLALVGQSSGGWGKITLHKNSISVADVEEGSEEGLRHLLESVLLQVNADLGGGSEQEAPESEDQPRESRDATMADRFRGFAEQKS